MDNLFAWEPRLGVGRHQEKPRLLETPLPVEGGIHGLGFLPVVVEVVIAQRSTGAVRRSPQAQPLPRGPRTTACTITLPGALIRNGNSQSYFARLG